MPKQYPVVKLTNVARRVVASTQPRGSTAAVVSAARRVLLSASSAGSVAPLGSGAPIPARGRAYPIVGRGKPCACNQVPAKSSSSPVRRNAGCACQTPLGYRSGTSTEPQLSGPARRALPPFVHRPSNIQPLWTTTPGVGAVCPRFTRPFEECLNLGSDASRCLQAIVDFINTEKSGDIGSYPDPIDPTLPISVTEADNHDRYDRAWYDRFLEVWSALLTVSFGLDIPTTEEEMIVAALGSACAELLSSRTQIFDFVTRDNEANIRAMLSAPITLPVYAVAGGPTVPRLFTRMGHVDFTVMRPRICRTVCRWAFDINPLRPETRYAVYHEYLQRLG